MFREDYDDTAVMIALAQCPYKGMKTADQILSPYLPPSNPSLPFSIHLSPPSFFSFPHFYLLVLPSR